MVIVTNIYLRFYMEVKGGTFLLSPPTIPSGSTALAVCVFLYDVYPQMLL
jgi:hypothetical protein